MRNRVSMLIACSLALALFMGLGVAPAAYAQVDAVTKPMKDLKLGFVTPGKIAKVHVKAGDRVKAGQVLIELDTVAREAVVEYYKLRENTDLPKQAAEARLKLSHIEQKRLEKAVKDGVASTLELERANAQVTVDTLGVQEAERAHLEAAAELKRESALLDQYYLRAPLDGIVEDVAMAEGEVVEQLKPILRLLVIDPMWVDAAVPTQETLGLKVGDAAWVRSQLPGHTKPIEGKVIHIASEADAGSQTRLVRVEIANPKGLPAGDHVLVTFSAPVPEKAVKADAK